MKECTKYETVEVSIVTDWNYFRHEKISNSKEKDSFTGIKIGSGPK